LPRIATQLLRLAQGAARNLAGSMRRMTKPQTKPFALCVDNSGYRASLIPGKVYRLLPDPRAAKDDLVRIADESGED
jgi:hypothetical protein